jgi:hypothetical protein
MAPPKYDDIEKTAKDVHSSRDFDVKKLLKLKYAAPVGITFTSESSVDAKKNMLVGKIVAEKYKVKQLPGLAVDKLTFANDKDGVKADLESSYAVPSVTGLKGLLDVNFTPAGAASIKAGCDFSASSLLVNAKFDQSTAGTIWATYSPLKDVVLGAKVLTTADMGLGSAEAKASYSQGPIFAALAAAVQKPKAKEGAKPAPDATIHLGYKIADGTKVAAEAVIASSTSVNLGVEHKASKDATLRVKASQSGELSALCSYTFAKGVTMITNMKMDAKYAATVGVQLNLDA